MKVIALSVPAKALWLAGLFVTTAASGPAPVKLTGWFSCEKCTAPKAARGEFRPSNPVCARNCIEKGSEPVFISEQGKELLKIRNYASIADDLGFHLEVTGIVEPNTKTISIEKVRRLEYEGASCARPRSIPRK